VKALLTVLLAFCTGAAFAQAKPCEWYKFENDDGIPVLAYSIPADLVHKGYTCIDKDRQGGAATVDARRDREAR
jgi:hypothetical protein